MYTYYNVEHLTTETPNKQREELFRALKGVSGVQGVVLKPATHQFEIESEQKGIPSAADVTEASMKAGFAAVSRS